MRGPLVSLPGGSNRQPPSWVFSFFLPLPLPRKALSNVYNDGAEICSVRSSFTSDVQSNLCTLLGSTDLISTFSSDLNNLQQSDLFPCESDCERGSALVRTAPPLIPFGLSPETFDRVGGWENLTVAVEEARSRIETNAELFRAITFHYLSHDSHPSPHEIMTSFISSLAALILQSSELGSTHYFHLHFSCLWALSSSHVESLAHCIVDSLMEREGISWPGSDTMTLEEDLGYHEEVAVHKIKDAFATLIHSKPLIKKNDHTSHSL